MKPISGSSKALNSFQRRLQRFRSSSSSKNVDDSKYLSKNDSIRISDLKKKSKPVTPSSFLKNSPVLKGNNNLNKSHFLAKKKNLFGGSIDQSKENKSPLSSLLTKSNFTKKKKNSQNCFFNGRPCSSDTRFAKSYKYGRRENSKVKKNKN